MRKTRASAGRRFSSPPPRPGRLSKVQELTLFIFLCVVLLGLIAYGVRA